jgi:O-antigen/teichoic acid export membrane protein
VNEPAPGSLYAERSVEDDPRHPSSGVPTETLSVDTLAALSARVNALAAHLDSLEPAIREVRRRADTLSIMSNGCASISRQVASGVPDRSVPVHADGASAPAAEELGSSATAGMTKIWRNMTSLMVAKGATMLLAIATVSIVPKYFGPETFGAISFAATFVGLFAIVSLLGSNPFLVKTIARDPTQLGSYIFNGLAMKLVLGSLLAAVAIAITHIAGYHPQTARLVEIGCLAMIIAALTDVLVAGLQGIERMGKVALWTGIQQYVAGAIGIGLVLAHKGVITYSLAFAVAGVVPFLACAYHLWPEIRGRMKLDLRLWRAIAGGGMPFFLWGALLLVYGSIDTLMLQAMTSSEVVGWYNLAYGWAGLPAALPIILASVVLPSLSSVAHANTSDFTRIVNRAIQIAFLVAIPMAVGLALVASDILRLLHYPAGFGHSVILIQILVFHVPIVAIDMILAVALTAKDRQKAWLVVGLIAVVFNPMLNLIAIPFTSHRYGNGAIGAAIVTVATELLMMIGAIYLRPAGVLDRATLSFLLRCIGAAVIMIPAVLVAGGLPLGVKVFVGVVTFACGTWALRLISYRPVVDVGIRKARLFLNRGDAATLPNSAD